MLSNMTRSILLIAVLVVVIFLEGAVASLYQEVTAGTGILGSGDDSIPATSSAFQYPYQLVYNTVLSKMLVADSSNSRVRGIDGSGIVSIFAGSSSGTDVSNAIAATSLYLHGPNGVAVDHDGNSLVAVYLGNYVFRISASDRRSTVFAGSGVASSSSSDANGDNGAASSASLSSPYSLFSNGSAVTYIVDMENHRVRMVNAVGIITTVAGTGVASTSSSSGPATQATLNKPSGVFCDSTGVLYISEFSGHYVKKVSVSGIISVYAGTGSGGYNGDGMDASSAELNGPNAVYGDSMGVLYIADYTNCRVRSVNTNGIISTILGTSNSASYGSPVVTATMATSTDISSPSGIFVDSTGVIHTSELQLSVVRSLYSGVPTIAPSAAPTIGPSMTPTADPSIAPSLPPSVVPSVAPTTLAPSMQPTMQPTFASGPVGPFYQFIEAGNGEAGKGAEGVQATSTTLSNPMQVTSSNVSPVDGLLVADYYNKRVRRIDSAGIVTTFAGDDSSSSSSDGIVATSAYIGFTYGVAVDTLGDVYVSSILVVYKISNGILSRYAGTGDANDCQNGPGDNGPATSAPICAARDLFFAGNRLYITNTESNRINTVDTNGVFGTVAGTGEEQSTTSESGAATSLPLDYPYGIYCDSTGRMYIGEFGGRVKVVSSSGIMSLFAGADTNSFSGDGGPATAAGVHSPYGVFGDDQGNIFFADSLNHAVRAVETNGIIRTVLGTGEQGFSLTSGMASSIAIYQPQSVHVDTTGLIHVTDLYCVLRQMTTVFPTQSPTVAPSLVPTRISLQPTVKFNPVGLYYQTVEAGTGVASRGPDNVQATSSALYHPYQMVRHSDPSVDGLLLTDAHNGRIRKIDSAGIVSLFAGNLLSVSSNDGVPATGLLLAYPTGLAIDASGNTLIVDMNNHRIFRVLNATFTSSGFAGTGVETLSGVTGDKGPATSATFSSPIQLFVSGSVTYVTDNANHRIRAIDANGIITTVAGNGGTDLNTGGVATSVSVLYPAGVFADSVGRLYITEQNPFNSIGYYVKILTSDGIISVVAGDSTGGFQGDGGPATSALLLKPYGVYGDTAGNIFVSDMYNNRLRAIDTHGIINTIFGTSAGVGQAVSSGDASACSINYPAGILIETTGVIHVSDSNDGATGSTVRRLTLIAPTVMPTAAPTLSMKPTAPTVQPTLSLAPVPVPSLKPTPAPSMETVVPTSPPSTPASASASQSAFSTGAVVGVAVGGIVLVVLVAFAYYKYTRSSLKVMSLSPGSKHHTSPSSSSNMFLSLQELVRKSGNKSVVAPAPVVHNAPVVQQQAPLQTFQPSQVAFMPMVASPGYGNPQFYPASIPSTPSSAVEVRTASAVTPTSKKVHSKGGSSSHKSVESIPHAKLYPKWLTDFAKRFSMEEKELDYFLGKSLPKAELPPLLLNRLSAKNIPAVVKFEELAVILLEMTDAFLTHNWGDGAKNHKKVAEVNRLLHAQGIVTWFDEERMTGDIKDKMQEGIDNCACVVVFITKEYMRKVGLPNDNCALEFKYACNTKMNTEIVPVVMEPECTNNKKWTGRVALELGGLLFINMSDSVTPQKVQELTTNIVAVVQEKLKDLVAMWLDKMREPVHKIVIPEVSLYDWLGAKINPSNVEYVCAMFLEAGIGSMKALVEKFLDNPQFLYDFDGVDEDDADEIVMGLEFIVGSD